MIKITTKKGLHNEIQEALNYAKHKPDHISLADWITVNLYRKLELK